MVIYSKTKIEFDYNEIFDLSDKIYESEVELSDINCRRTKFL